MGINGWLIVDKPTGISSRDVVNIVSKSLNEKKVGHAGTLDPLASGLLPIAIGEATKTVGAIQNFTKKYKFTLKWGEMTSTDDKLGKVISKNRTRPSLKEIKSNLHYFMGEIEQVPPNYSAVKLDGKRAYKLARKGIDFKLKPRKVFIYSLSVLYTKGEDYCTFNCFCSKGTYVRALARDLGIHLNCYAHITSLRRTNLGNFSNKNAILLDLSKKLIHSSAILNKLISINKMLKIFPKIKLSRLEERKIKNGQKINLENLKYVDNKTMNYLISNKSEFMICKYRDNPTCFFKIEDKKIIPKRVFNL